MEELWMEIPDYDGDYQVSNLGQVKSLKKGKEKILSPLSDKDGYIMVCLCKNGKRKYHKVHRLVASAFVPGYQEGLVVNHIDENKSNNIYTNLEWTTVRQNTIYGTGLQRGIATRQNNRGKTIYCRELDRTFATQREAAEFFGCGRQYIGHCLSGSRDTVKGYHIEYI